MRKFLLIFTFLVLVIGIVAIALFVSNLPTANTNLQQISGSLNNGENNLNIVCQSDVLLCDNGGYVSRNPEQNCEFDCSQAKEPVNGIAECPQDVKQCDDGSFVIRNINNKCEFKTCK